MNFGLVRCAPPDEYSAGEMFEATYLFLAYLFKTFGLRKVHAEIPGFNWDLFESGTDSLFLVEATLEGRDFYDGKFWGNRIVSIDVDRLRNKLEPLFAELISADSADGGGAHQ